jgi:hypothetical protein
VEVLLTRTHNISTLAYLRTLASTHNATKRLVHSLKAYCERGLAQPAMADDSKLVSVDSSEETLDRCMDDLFVPYTEGNRYLYKEKTCLAELFGNVIAEYLNFMVSQGPKKEGTSAHTSLPL